ncbi:MAG: hypothetical protein BSR46_16085 [Candidatus Dactylopiibacterium carminicum]|nr:MAG: hypothetical protein BSR46_16085 [Candidatus Dactylopiibacterium carminicum]
MLDPAGPFEPVERALPAHFSDLQLDRIFAEASAPFAAPGLNALFQSPCQTPAVIAWRQTVMRELEQPDLAAAVDVFCGEMESVHCVLSMPAGTQPEARQTRWFVEVARRYCAAVQTFAAALAPMPLTAGGWLAWREYLQALIGGAGFMELQAHAEALCSESGALRYELLLDGNQVSVLPARDEAPEDYGAVLKRDFAAWLPPREKSVVNVFPTRQLDPVEAGVLEGVRTLYPALFAQLAEFRRVQADFVDAGVARFLREVQFHRAWLAYIEPLRAAGMAFCYPTFSTDGEVQVRGLFDLALARQRAAQGQGVVCNDLSLGADERVVIVTGPNQAGKTTFARAFGQLHHLAVLGCAVPAASACLRLCPKVLTHFEREENFAELRSKLEDDLVRMREILAVAGPDSLVLMNEVFASTTLQDAAGISHRSLQALLDSGALGLIVTFIDELATPASGVVSLVGVMTGADPGSRSFRFARQPADGHAYAMAIAARHGLTYEQIRESLSS